MLQRSIQKLLRVASSSEMTRSICSAPSSSWTSSDPWRLLHNSVSSAWKMCHPSKTPVPAQTYLRYLSSCRETHQNIKARRPHPFYFQDPIWQQPADLGQMIDGEMSKGGKRKRWFHTKIISCLIFGWFPFSCLFEEASRKSDVPWNNRDTSPSGTNTEYVTLWIS